LVRPTPSATNKGPKEDKKDKSSSDKKPNKDNGQATMPAQAGASTPGAPAPGTPAGSAEVLTPSELEVLQRIGAKLSQGGSSELQEAAAAFTQAVTQLGAAQQAAAEASAAEMEAARPPPPLDSQLATHLRKLNGRKAKAAKAATAVSKAEKTLEQAQQAHAAALERKALADQQLSEAETKHKELVAQLHLQQRGGTATPTGMQSDAASTATGRRRRPRAAAPREPEVSPALLGELEGFLTGVKASHHTEGTSAQWAQTADALLQRLRARTVPAADTADDEDEESPTEESPARRARRSSPPRQEDSDMQPAGQPELQLKE
jgi:hypothetical protein